MTSAIDSAPSTRIQRDVVEGGDLTCNFSGVLTLSHPISLEPRWQYFLYSRDILKAMEITLDFINTERCGINLPNGDNMKIELITYDDKSDKETVRSIIENTLLDNSASFPTPDYYLGPYSSGLTGIQAPLTQQAGKLTIAGGSASTAVFRDRNLTFGTIPPAHVYLDTAIALLAKAGVKTIASFHEDVSFTTQLCGSLSELCEEYGIELIRQESVPNHPTKEMLDPIAKNFSFIEEPPDAVVSCVYETGCLSWIQSMRAANWSPKAQVLTTCIGMDSFEAAVGLKDAEYLTGVSPWDKSMQVQDHITGWSAKEFSDLFFNHTLRSATYQGASGGSTVSILVQALEKAIDWKDTNEIASILATETFETFYGDISFDVNGQSKSPLVTMQYHRDMKKLVALSVFPEEHTSVDFVYPMPTWLERDCRSGRRCEGDPVAGIEGIGICSREGLCICGQNDDVSIKYAQYGYGESATCVRVPEENFNFIPSYTINIGVALVCLQGIFFTVALAWTYKYRNKHVVKVSQPKLSVILAIGCMVQVMCIIPLAQQGEYRVLKDENTYRLTDEINPEVVGLDLACMAAPWIYFIGVAITFSGLFAKILRVKKVYEQSLELRRVKLKTKDMIFTIVITLSFMTILMVIWQFVAPFQWHREIVLFDPNQYPLVSMGQCSPTTSYGWYLSLPPFIAQTVAFCYVLHLCYVTRNVPDSFHDTKWIGISIACIIQINILALPLLLIAYGTSPAVSFTVKSILAFLQGASVILFIYVPKMIRLYKCPNEGFVPAKVGSQEWRMQLKRNSDSACSPEKERNSISSQISRRRASLESTEDINQDSNLIDADNDNSDSEAIHGKNKSSVDSLHVNFREDLDDDEENKT